MISSLVISAFVFSSDVLVVVFFYFYENNVASQAAL